MRLHTWLCGLALLFLIAAPSPVLSGGNEGKENLITVIGTVTYIDLEGGFYGILADSGERYFPLNLDEQYKVDGLKVRVKGKVKENVMTAVMWGTPLEILRIEKQ